MSLVNTAVSKGRKLTREILQSDKGADRKGSSQKREKFCISLFSLRGLMLHTKAQLFQKVVLQRKLLFPLYPAAPCGRATKQRETFHLPSNLFTAPLPPGRKQIGRQVEGKDHNKP